MFSRQENEQNTRHGWSSHGDWLNRSLNFFPYWFFSYSDLYKRLLAAAASHVSDAGAAFVTHTAPLRSLLFISVIPQFKGRFCVVYSASSITRGSDYLERDKWCYPAYKFTASSWLVGSPKTGKRQVFTSLKIWVTLYINGAYEGGASECFLGTFKCRCHDNNKVCLTRVTKDWRRRPSSNLTLIAAFSSQVAHLTGSRFQPSLSHSLLNINLNLNHASDVWASTYQNQKQTNPVLRNMQPSNTRNISRVVSLFTDEGAVSIKKPSH